MKAKLSKATLSQGTMKIYETKEVEVQILTHEQAIDFWDAFTQSLYDSIDDDCEWQYVLKHIRDFSKEACENYGIKD